MSGKAAVVGDDDVISQPAIVTQMGVTHNEAIVTNLGCDAVCRSFVNRCKLSDGSIFTDNGI